MFDMGFAIYNNNDNFTQISNLFIKEYMTNASGNHIKVYMYLLMESQNPGSIDDLSISTLADLLECTEKDVLRALRYWKKENLISIEAGEDEAEIQSITILSLEHESAPKTKATTAKITPLPIVSQVPNTAVEVPVPDKHEYSPLQTEAFCKDAEVSATFNTVEALLGEPLSQTHIQNIIYYMCDLDFSPALITTLYETAVGKGKKQPNYIDAIAISWAKKGIKTPEEAVLESEEFSGKYSTVTRAFGLNRNLAPKEKEIIDSWQAYNFSDAIITEACTRTIMQTGVVNLKYTSKILEQWHKNNVSSYADIEKVDKAFHNSKKNTSKQDKPSNNKKNQFQQFPQRNYSASESDSLEKRLLQIQ